MTELTHLPTDSACVGFAPGRVYDRTVHACPICSPERYAAIPRGQFGRCATVDNGGDAHFRPHECRAPLDKNGRCPWHGADTGV